LQAEDVLLDWDVTAFTNLDILDERIGKILKKLEDMGVWDRKEVLDAHVPFEGDCLFVTFFFFFYLSWVFKVIGIN
jgi:hypothetical protein